MFEYAWLIPVFPFLAFALITAFGRRLPGQGAYVAIGAMTLSALWSLGILARGTEGAHFEANTVVATLLNRPLEVGYTIDGLTAVMLFVVTVVGTLIFVYSIGYMHGDPRVPRFFAYMSLFAGSMLTLVLANNFLLMFVGWELVGLCSYLLIGFWFERPSAASAGKKAFVVNRVGDWGVLVALFLIWTTFGTFRFFGESGSALTTGVLDDPGRILTDGSVA